MISKKNILQSDFEGEKILARKYLAKKNPTLTKNLSWRIMLEKKSYTVVFQEKKGQKSITQTKSLIPPPPSTKVKW